MVLQLPIPINKQTDVASSSSASDSPALNSLHSINRDVAATPIISNLASGVYPIGGGVDQQRTSSLQKMQQQQQSSFGASNSMYNTTTQRIQQGSLTQQTQMMHTNPSLYNNFNATQMMPANSMQSFAPTSNNSGMNNNMSPWMRMGMGGQPNLLGQVTVGGRSLLNQSLMTTGDSSSNNNSRGMSLLGGRGRMEGPPPRPSIPSESGVFQSGQNTVLTNRLQIAPSKAVNFEELPVSTLEDGGTKDSSETANDEQVAFTTELLTLSVHEALTFEGVELALHPDLFHRKDGTRNQEGGAIGIQPGDLVEIRVWSPRPGITTTPKSPTKSKPKVLTGKRPSLHSRNTSLASSINSSLLATASSPSVHSANSSPNTAIPDQTQVPSDAVGKNSNLESPGLLAGEQFLETPPTQGNNASAPSTFSLLTGAASSLFRNTNQPADSHTPSSVLVPGVPTVPSLVPSQKTSVSSESTIASHSRDNSITTMSTLAGMHSRDSSLLVGMHSRDSSLLQTSSNLSNNSSPTKESPLTSPQANSTEAVNEGLPQTLITNLSLHSLTESNDGSQTLPPRRDGPSLLATTAMPSPLQQHPTLASTRPETKVTQTSLSTPLSTTPPTKSPISKSPSNKSPSQRPPVALPPLPREQAARDSNDIKQGNATARHFSDSHTTLHARNDSISSTIPVSTESLAGTGSHRRHSTAIPGFSQPGPPLIPPSHRNNLKNVLNRNISDDDIATDVLESLQETHFVRISFVMPVSDQSLKSIKSSARTKVSLLRRVADLYQITSFDTVTVTQIPKHTRPFVQQRISADFVTITFKDQFVSRGDMFYFQRSFLNSWVYEGKRLSFNGIRTNTKVIRHGDHIVRSGIISEETKLTFRSRSARIIWLVQMSSEMWDFASPYMAVGNQKNREPTCETYFNKFITFARKLFEKWKQLELTHNLTVVFFSRTFIRQKEDLRLSNTPSVIHTDSDGRMYCDHYRIVLNNETRTTDWESLVHRMKQAFVNYPREVKWDLTPGKERIPSTAGQGNILEAVNMTLNLLHLHFIDRDLHRTGNSIVIMTAGNGVFEVSKNLAGITKQRMMDNGIGSDMLSLGLPPLHVIPFFLFRNDNKENIADEAQGFDDDGGAGSSFEVPHWMNLSYVDYDDDEEAMLYKEHINDDADDAKEQGENDTNNNSSVSNGFLRRNKPACRDNVSTPLSDEVATAKDHARHLISQRNFEDILQACRPRNRGEYGSGLPASLTTLLKKFSPDVIQPSLSGQVVALDQAVRLTPQRSSARAKNFEWGAVNFDEFNMNKLSSSVQRAQFLRMSTSGSDSSSASSFTSIGSHIHQSMSGTYLQSTASLGGQSNVVGDDSSTTLDIDGENPQGDNADPVLMMKKMMREHDKQAFSGRSGRVSPTNSFANSFNSDTAGSPKLDGSPLERSQSAMFPLLTKNSGGIEAALAQYDGSTPVSTDVKPIAAVPVSAEDKRLLSTSPTVSTMPFTFSLDRRNEGYNSNFARLGPERITALTEGLQPFDFQRKSLSKGLGERRSSFAHVMKQQVPESPIKTPIRSKSKKHSYHQHRYRRKVWVLNPFRQEDEDEVLAKRTHNRRRWSHVFPLGEAEFKKHAGPNWKSLCQPAILPMTIDFHPDPAELQDQAKFRIKQYSVTLPPFGETNYKDATELLDDLLVQRMRQDFQLVPRSILSAQRETENTTNHTLSRTLSMGHKIQKLSYNPSSDSVDVVQYYANFAENESPQSYRYLLWSALRQDYVSVVQTFTKYTSPYKWNELDMLLSDDTIKSISDEMRHPRISFVILPDPFADQFGENEYASKFNKLVDYFNKLQSKGSATIDIEMIKTSDAVPKSSKAKRSFIVDLRKRNSDKYEWCEIVLDSNCDTRRTFRITIQWLVAIGSKIDQQAQLLSRRCAQFGLNLIHIPSFSSMRNSFLNPFAVPITFPLRSKSSVDSLEKALTNDFDFVYDGSHLADPNELIDCLDGFDFTVNRWSMNKRKKFVPVKQYLHRTGTLFMRLVRDAQGKAIVISYLNNRHIAGDQQLLDCARAVFIQIEQFITVECKKAGC